MGEAWENGTLPDQHGRPVVLSGLMFTRPDGQHLDPAYVSRHMQVIARRVGLCCAVVSAASAGTAVVTVGRRHIAPEGTWMVYRDRDPIGAVTVTKCIWRRGSGATLTLAEPLTFNLRPKDELGQRVLSRRRLHDLRHSSASIQLDAGVDLALISKRHGHSSTAITSDLYVHLLCSARQRAAEAVASAVPRASRVPTSRPQLPNEESAEFSES
ncbi:tyrosine-type recombinase/integrase [Frankia sp. Cpl3]|nr:tyrosine-type recombinase/integrase [Parafrankia colletiae]MCK9900411.1 tyrosine-type recombinase/integrase [Frankia sp. Cpl3]